MSSIIIPATFTDTSLPIDTDLASYISARSELHSWFQADTDRATIASGAVASLKTLKAASSVTLDQATADYRGTLSAKAAIAGYEALNFDGANDRYAFSDMPDFSTAFSIVLLLSAPTPTGSKNIFGRFTAANQQTTLQLGTVGLFYYTNNASATILPAAEFVADTPMLVMLSWSGNVGRAKVNNRALQTFAATGSASAAAAALGSLSSAGANPFLGWISDVMVFTSDLLAAGNESLLATVRAYFAGTYGLDIQ